MRKVEQSPRAAFDQLYLDLTKRLGASLGADLADVDRQFGTCAILKNQCTGPALDYGFTNGLKRRAIHTLDDFVTNLLIRNCLQVRVSS